MAMQQVGKMSLKNAGGFVARIQYSYIDDDGVKRLTRQGSDIPLGQTDTIDPSEFGVPDGATIYMHVFVVLGHDNEANRGFVYSKGSGTTARYTISGTTLNNDLGLNDVN